MNEGIINKILLTGEDISLVIDALNKARYEYLKRHCKLTVINIDILLDELKEQGGFNE